MSGVFYAKTALCPRRESESDMNPILRQLLALQEIDTEFIRVQRAVKAGPAEADAAAAARDAARAAVTEKEETIREAELRIEENNLEALSAEAEIEKLKAKLKSVKNNKEYTIIKDAIGQQNERKDQHENIALEHMEKVEALRKEVEELAPRAQTAEEEFARISAEVERETSALREEAQALRIRRQEACAGLDGEIFAEYEQVLRANQGLAVVEMVGGACQGCFRKLSPNNESQVVIGRDVVRCQGCGRFLYCREGAPQGEEA